MTNKTEDESDLPRNNPIVDPEGARLLTCSTKEEKTTERKPLSVVVSEISMPPSSLGGAGGIMFLYLPSVSACVGAHVMSLVCIDGFLPDLSVVHLGTKMNWLGFGIKRSKVKGQGHSMTRCAKNAILGLVSAIFPVYILSLVHLRT